MKTVALVVRRRWKAFALPISLMFLITGFSALPLDGGPDALRIVSGMRPVLQNLLHIPVFGLLAYLWLRAFCRCDASLAACVTASFVITIGFGFFDEIHQRFVPGRHAGLLDIMLNTIGSVLGIGVFLAYRRFSAFSGLEGDRS